MGPISSVRPVVQTLGTSPHLSAGSQSSGGTAAHNGARVEPAAEVLVPRAVKPAVGPGEAVSNLTEDSYAIEAARSRAEAAQRAYMMTSLMAGKNPLSDPVP